MLLSLNRILNWALVLFCVVSTLFIFFDFFGRSSGIQDCEIVLLLMFAMCSWGAYVAIIFINYTVSMKLMKVLSNWDSFCVCQNNLIVNTIFIILLRCSLFLHTIYQRCSSRKVCLFDMHSVYLIKLYLYLWLCVSIFCVQIFVFANVLQLCDLSLFVFYFNVF